MRCATCRYWDSEAEGDMRRCKKIVQVAVEFSGNQLAEIVAQDRAELKTWKDFGCNLHEPKMPM